VKFICRLPDRLFIGLGICCCCFGLCAFSFQPAHAQTFAEWFEQKKTLVKYLGQQIAALEAFDKEVRQANGMLKSDWGLIANFKDGELDLHTDYYASLKAVNPVVKAGVDMAALQSEVSAVESLFNGLQGLVGLSDEERVYAASVGKGVMAGCSKELADLQTVLTAGELAMTDADRMVRLGKITASVKEAYVFSCSFCASVRTLAVQRNDDLAEPVTLGRLYGTGD